MWKCVKNTLTVSNSVEDYDNFNFEPIMQKKKKAWYLCLR